MMSSANGDRPESMLPADWGALGPLLDAVLEAPTDERATRIASLCANDLVRFAALAALVADCERELPLLDGDAAARFPALNSEVEAPLLPERIGDRYQLGRELGRGGMARVYLALDTKYGRDVAIKVIRPELAASLGRDRFLREIDIASRLRHPNIMPLFDSGELNGVLYFVMPYEAGPSIRERLRTEGRLQVADASRVLHDVARALIHAHEHGVVHRDIKPDNIMLSGDAAVVTDFGTAKAVTAALAPGSGVTVTQKGARIGTPLYMSPEQTIGDPSTDHRTDIYAFGCLAYELLTGRPPFPGRSVQDIAAAHKSMTPRPVTDARPEVPAAMASMISACLQKSPHARPQTMREILRVVEGDDAAGAAVPLVVSTSSSKWSKASIWAVTTMLTLALATAAYVATR
jgi:serine/threonine-protein kinase